MEDRLESPAIDISAAGTPQGSVPSQMLFNLILIRLPGELNKIDSLHHSIYADDNTIWVYDDCDDSRLQTSMNTVGGHLIGTGHTCSTEKSEILLRCLLLASRCVSRNQAYEEIRVHTGNYRNIPTVSQLKVLGLVIENKGTHGDTDKELQAKVTNTIRLIK